MRLLNTLMISLMFTGWVNARELDFSERLISSNLIQEENTSKYFEISSITVEEVQALEIDDKDIAGDIGSVITIVDKLIALGQKVWPIIKAGKPVINNDLNKIHPIYVLPSIASQTPEFTFYAMSGWNMPVSKSYRVSYKNGFGAEVIGFTYTVLMQGGGQYEGSGNYLGGVQVVASNISVAWGFEFNANSTFLSAMNLGTVESPVAGAMLRIDYKAKSILKEIVSSEVFTVNGLGVIQKN